MSESAENDAPTRCRVCGAMVTGPADPAHDGAEHDAWYADDRPSVIPPAACACGHPSDDHDDTGACMHLCDCAWPIPPASTEGEGG